MDDVIWAQQYVFYIGCGGDVGEDDFGVVCGFCRGVVGLGVDGVCIVGGFWMVYIGVYGVFGGNQVLDYWCVYVVEVDEGDMCYGRFVCVGLVWVSVSKVVVFDNVYYV